MTCRVGARRCSRCAGARARQACAVPPPSRVVRAVGGRVAARPLRAQFPRRPARRARGAAAHAERGDRVLSSERSPSRPEGRRVASGAWSSRSRSPAAGRRGARRRRRARSCGSSGQRSCGARSRLHARRRTGSTRRAARRCACRRPCGCSRAAAPSPRCASRTRQPAARPWRRARRGSRRQRRSALRRPRRGSAAPRRRACSRERAPPWQCLTSSNTIE